MLGVWERESMNIVDWNGGHVVRTHMTIAELLSIDTAILSCFSGLAYPFQLRFGSSVIHIQSVHAYLLYRLALRILATLPRGSLKAL